MPKQHAKLLDEQSVPYTSSYQNDYLCRTYRLQDGRRLRVSVTINAYDFQSDARAELWSGTEWHEVASYVGPHCGKDKVATEHRLFEEALRVIADE